MTRSPDLGDLPPAPPETRRQRAVYWRYRTAWEVAARLPGPLARRAPRRLGGSWHRFASERQRAQVRANLGRVVPDASAGELDELVHEAYVSYARYWLDSFRLHVMDPSEIVAAATSEGLEHIDALLDSGRGGILATGHLGSWDVGACFTAQRDWGMVVVAELVEPRRLFERFVRLRRQAGIDVIPLVRGQNLLAHLERRIGRDGALATLLADRDLTRRGPIVEFFGEPCRLPVGAAALARSTGRPVAVGAFLTDGDRFHGVAHEPVHLAGLSIYDGMQVIAGELERLIRRAPEQWHVFVPNWLADREPAHPVVTAWREGRDWRPLARRDHEARRRRRAGGGAPEGASADPAPARGDGEAERDRGSR